MYPHAPGDGRERIAALKSAVKIRAEDGRYLEQFAEEGQLEACGWILRKVKSLLAGESTSNAEAIQTVFREIEEDELKILTPYNSGRLSLPRPHEVLAILNRIRG